MKGKFDPSKLILITANRRKSEPFDLRYTKAQRFRFSREAWENLNLDNLGVSMFKYPGGAIVLSVQAEEVSQVLKQREGSTKKGNEFTSTELARLLVLTLNDGDQADFQLNLLSVADNVTYLTIVPFSEKQFTADARDTTVVTDTDAKATSTEAVVDTDQSEDNVGPSIEPEDDTSNEDTDEEGQGTAQDSEELDSTVFDTPDGEAPDVVQKDPLEFLKED